MKNRKFKSQVGAISVFVMIALLFFLVTIVGVYVISSRRAQSQSEALEMAQDKYYKEGEENVIYDSKIMNSSDTIPIFTKEHYWSIGEDTAIEIEGKVYDFSSTDYKNYELQNDIVINMETDLKNSKFKDDLFCGDKITKNGHEILYYYQGKYYKPVAYSEDGTNETKLAEGEKVLSVSGTDFSKISSKVTGLTGKYYLFSKVVIIPRGLEVGDYVTYEPSGTYNWQAEYASSDLTPVTDDVTLNSATGEEFNITSWKVFSIDEEKQKVELVPNAPTTGTVRLQGAQGYNNAVKLLNDACNSLYGNGSTITARSISIEDIEGAMTEEALAEAHMYVNIDSNTTWGNQLASSYTEKKQYPAIYAKENLSVINGEKNTAGLGMRDQSVLIGRTDEGATNGKITTATSIQPYQTYWTNGNAFMQTAFKGEGTGTSNKNYCLILPSGTSTNYWMASRCVDVDTDYCDFYVNRIHGGGMGAYYMCNSYVNENNYSRPLFPIVSLSAREISGNDTDGWKVE